MNMAELFREIIEWHDVTKAEIGEILFQRSLRRGCDSDQQLMTVFQRIGRFVGVIDRLAAPDGIATQTFGIAIHDEIEVPTDHHQKFARHPPEIAGSVETQRHIERNRKVHGLAGDDFVQQRVRASDIGRGLEMPCDVPRQPFLLPLCLCRHEYPNLSCFLPSNIPATLARS